MRHHDHGIGAIRKVVAEYRTPGLTMDEFAADETCGVRFDRHIQQRKARAP